MIGGRHPFLRHRARPSELRSPTAPDQTRIRAGSLNVVPRINCATLDDQLTPASDEPRWYTVSQILQFRQAADDRAQQKTASFSEAPPQFLEMPRRSAPHRCRACDALGRVRLFGIPNDDCAGAGSGCSVQVSSEESPLQGYSVIIIPFHLSYQMTLSWPLCHPTSSRFTVQGRQAEPTVQTCNRSGLRAGEQTMKQISQYAARPQSRRRRIPNCLPWLPYRLLPMNLQGLAPSRRMRMKI